MKLKKMLAIILALSLIVSNSSMIVFAETIADPGVVVENESEIVPGETKTITVEAGAVTKLKFVPAIGGKYAFTSISEEDTYGYLYDSEMNELAGDDDSAGNVQFCVRATLNAGETYYWGAKYLSEYTAGEFQVKLVCEKADCNHEDRTAQPGEEATCYTDGYTAGQKCETCGEWASGHEKIEAGHLDQDENGVCDSCQNPLEGMEAYTCGGFYIGEDDSYDGSAKYYLYNNGLLEIYGEGVVRSEYFQFDERIKKVIVKEGITRIGWHAFFECPYMTEITIMNPDCSIDDGASTIPYGATIIGHKDSPAETYANDYGRPFFVYCEHENVTKDDGVEAACQKYGYTAGTQCNDCGRWASGHERIEATHIDDDDNEICDSCKKLLTGMQKGTCGGHSIGEDEAYDGSAKYYLYTDGTLEVYGEGTIRPWGFEWQENIKKVIIEEGITAIGWGAFCGCNNVSEITIMNPECQIAPGEDTLPYFTTIIGHEGSTADEYALEYDRDFLAYCEHENVTEVEAVEASCNSFGYTEGAICEDCDRYAYGHERIIISHEDEDEDEVCDLCESEMPVKSGDCSEDRYNEGESFRVEGVTKYYLYENGTLEIYGEGRVGDGQFERDDEIKRVIVREGVTEIGCWAFWECSNMKEITILNPDCFVEGFDDTIPYDVTIIGHKNSTAEAYAEEHYREFLEYCPHENAVKVSAVEAKCNAYGYTEGAFCDDCKRWVYGHDAIVISHEDKDGDDICDICEREMPIDSGRCGYDYEEGQNPYARFYLYADGTLEIYGEGEVEAWFFEYRPSIKKVIAGEGVTEFGSNAFDSCYNIKEFTVLNPECQFPEYGRLLPRTATIIGYEDSTAQRYAQNWLNVFKVYCIHENCEQVDSVTGGCYTDGYTAGEKCKDCGEWATGHYRIKASHHDEDGDDVCDRCEKTMPISEGACGDLLPNEGEEEGETRRYSDSVRYYKYADGMVEIFGEGAIGKWVFSDSSDESEDLSYYESIREIVIHEGITEIKAKAFYDCYEMESITIPASVSKINIYAFEGCDSLDTVILSDDTESVKWSTFENCYDVTFFVSSKAEDVIKHLKKKKCTYEIKPESIEIVSNPKRNFYEKYEYADLKGLVIEAAYEDGTTKRIKRGFKATGFDSSKAGMQTVTVSYGGVKDSYKTRVLDEIELEYTSTIYNGKLKTPGVTVNGLTEGVDYTVSYENNRESGRAKVLIKGIGDYKGTIEKPFTIKLPTPENVKVTTVASTGLPKVTWSGVDGELEYYVYRATSKTGTYSYVGWSYSTSFVDTEATAGKTYYYKVKAVSYNYEDSNSALSDYDYVTCDLARPSISISNVASTGKIKLSWNAVKNADRYEIQRSVGNDDNYVSYKTTTSTTFTNTSTNAGTTYYYRVRAIYDDKSVANSAWAYEYQTCDLAAPKITVSGTKSPGKIVISWDKVEDADRYYIYRATSKNGTYSKYDTTTSTTYTNSYVTKGKYYYYKVRAIYDGKSTANSAYSNIDYAYVR